MRAVQTSPACCLQIWRASDRGWACLVPFLVRADLTVMMMTTFDPDGLNPLLLGVDGLTKPCQPGT